MNVTYGVVQPGVSESDGIPMIRVNNFVGHSISTSDVMRIDPSIESKYQRTRLQAGDVLITIVGSVGQVAIVPSALAGWNIARAVALIRPKTAGLSRWIAFVLRSPIAQHQLGITANTTVQTTINLKDLRALSIPLPPEAVRANISSVLGALDDRIELLRQANTTLEAIAQVLFKSWFVDFDPVRAKAEGLTPAGMDADTAALFPSEFYKTELGLIPKGWGLEELGSLLDICDGKTWPKHSRVDFSEVSVFGANGRVGYSPTALGVGRVIFLGKIGSCGAINESNGAWWASNNAFFISKNNNPFLEWARFILKGIDFAQYVGGSSNPYMPLKNFSHHKIISPPAAILAAFETICSPVRDQHEANVDFSIVLANLRDTLLPRLISGKLRLPEAESLVEAAVA